MHEKLHTNTVAGYEWRGSMIVTLLGVVKPVIINSNQALTIYRTSLILQSIIPGFHKPDVTLSILLLSAPALPRQAGTREFG